MKYYELPKEEQELLEEYEKGEFKSVSDLKTVKEQFSQIAKNTLNKARNINIRLSEKDLVLLKRKAVEEGIPYQTLVSSVLHKFVSK